MLGVVALCWMAAGPGGVVVRAQRACHHTAMGAHHARISQSRQGSTGGPCFCSRMVGAFDQALSVALPSLVSPLVLTVSPIVSVADPLLRPFPPSQSAGPETPPPIPQAA